MLNYRGQYRVSFEMNKQGKPCEFAFIPCAIKKGSNICRHNDNVLNIYIPSSKIINRLQQEHPDLFKSFQAGNGEGTLLFNEIDLPEVAKILKIRTKGCNVSPRSKRNASLLAKPVGNLRKVG